MTRLPSCTPQRALASASTTRMVGAPYMGSPVLPITAAFIRVSWARVSASCTTTIFALWRFMALGAKVPARRTASSSSFVICSGL